MSDPVHDLGHLPPLRDIIREHNLRAEKSLGQNFLLDLNLTGKIARQAKTVSGRTVFEIGPGPGGLTRALLESGAAKVIAIEYDPRAILALQSLKEAADGRLVIVQADALNADLPALGAAHGAAPPYAIVANLPYNIATPLLTGWLEDVWREPSLYGEFILMFQKEVAQRITAKCGDKAYGRLAILSQWLCECKIALDVPAAAFTPPPKVTSSVVRLVPRGDAGGVDFHTLEKLTAAAFGQRRKMIRGSLKSYMDVIESCGINPELRAEDLPVQAYIDMARAVAARKA